MADFLLNAWSLNWSRIGENMTFQLYFELVFFHVTRLISSKCLICVFCLSLDISLDIQLYGACTGVERRWLLMGPCVIHWAHWPLLGDIWSDELYDKI
jgi:hypothetical protein